MNIGNIVEYIDQQKIICAVVLQIKNQKLRLLTENNREVKLSAGRVSHYSDEGLDISVRRDLIVNHLKSSSQKRRELTEQIDIKELWELLHEEGEEIHVDTMTVFCFDPPLTSDHEAAVIRAFFNDRLFFKFNKDRFLPHTPEQIELKLRQLERVERRNRLIKTGADWIKGLLNPSLNGIDRPNTNVIDILKDYYIFDNESNSASVAKAILKEAGAESRDQIFPLFVKAGIWQTDENLDLVQMDIPVEFPPSVLEKADEVIESADDFLKDPKRINLTHLPIITIDGQSTLDYDDAISLEKHDDGYTIGIHIIDVGFYIKKGDSIDLHAMERGSSIYMPDDKIPMLPPKLSEDLCSLKEGAIRPGITTLVRLNRFFELIDFEIVPSIIKVHQQMTYTEANLLNGEDDPVTTLYKAATVLREKRMKAGAVQITLPEVNLWLEENGTIGIVKIDRENPARMLVSEMMILANGLMADFLVANDMPGVFRSQPEPKQRLYQGIETSLFLNCMQRKQLNRAIISTKADYHSGLGLKAYVTATSPIRRYFDLLTQRQIRGILGYEPPYTREELDSLLQVLEIPVGNTGRIQYQRRRYWLFKHLETLKGSVLDAIVLETRRTHHMVLLKDFMLEWRLPFSHANLKPGDLIQLTVQHADARRDQLSLFV